MGQDITQRLTPPKNGRKRKLTDKTKLAASEHPLGPKNSFPPRCGRLKPVEIGDGLPPRRSLISSRVGIDLGTPPSPNTDGRRCRLPPSDPHGCTWDSCG